MEVIKTAKKIFSEIWILILIVMVFGIVAFYYVRNDIIFKYQVDINDYSDGPKGWLKIKRVWYINDKGNQYNFISRSSATMFKMIWG